MAITGLTLPSTHVVAQHPNVGEAVDVTVSLFKRLGVVSDEQSLRESLSGDYELVAGLGNGRLYPELPAAITTVQLIELANVLAVEHKFDQVFRWAPFWAPGTERQSVTEAELNGDAKGFTARLALYAEDSAYDPLLHFTGLSYDDKYREKNQLTQLEQFNLKWGHKPVGTSLRFSDQRDFLVWYIMDLIREKSKKDIVLAEGFMRVPRHGRRTVVGDSYVGRVHSSVGRARLGGSRGYADPGYGVGLSVGFEA